MEEIPSGCSTKNIYIKNYKRSTLSVSSSTILYSIFLVSLSTIQSYILSVSLSGPPFLFFIGLGNCVCDAYNSCRYLRYCDCLRHSLPTNHCRCHEIKSPPLQSHQGEEIFPLPRRKYFLPLMQFSAPPHEIHSP